MRSLALSLVFLSSLALQAQPPRLARPEPQTLESIKLFASAHLQDLSCNEVPQPGNSKSITIEMVDPTGPRHGTSSSIDTGSMFQDVFAVSSNTDFEFDHWGTLKGKRLAVYRYSNQINGKTHAGMVFADESTGAISRIIFRATDSAAHLFCTTQSR
jgi:hypothetical protein